MAQSRKVTTCAVTGSIHTPSMSPYLPVSAQQIADAAVGAAKAGAAIVHLHARKFGNGRSDQSPDAFHASPATSSHAATWWSTSPPVDLRP